VLIAALAAHDKQTGDDKFEQFFQPIMKQCTDERKYVKKAVNWALRGIGKRNKRLNEKAVQTAYEILDIGDTTAKWIARDVLRELTSNRVQNRIFKK